VIRTAVTSAIHSQLGDSNCSNLRYSQSVRWF